MNQKQLLINIGSYIYGMMTLDHMIIFCSHPATVYTLAVEREPVFLVLTSYLWGPIIQTKYGHYKK